MGRQGTGWDGMRKDRKGRDMIGLGWDRKG